MIINWNSEQPQIFTAEEMDAYLQTYGRTPTFPVHYEEFRELVSHCEDLEREVSELRSIVQQLHDRMLAAQIL